MRQPSIEEQVRDYVAEARHQIMVPHLLARRILRAVDTSEAVRPSVRFGRLRLAATMVAVVLLASSVGLVRLMSGPAGAGNPGAWSAGPTMATARADHTATLLQNGDVLVVGGRGSEAIAAAWQPGGDAIASAELYSPRTKAWTPAGRLATPRFAHTATLLRDGTVLVVGGDRSLPTPDAPISALASAERYDPASNRWSTAGSMHQARSNHTATLLPDGRVLVAGGIQPETVCVTRTCYPAIVLASAEVYDPTTNSWTAAAPMPSPRAQQSAVKLADGRVLLAGGIDRFSEGIGSSPTVGLNTAALYDPSANSWASPPLMRYARISPSATLLPGDRVLVVGDGGVNRQTAELYDAASDRWIAAPNPLLPHTGHVAVALRNGKALLAGGLAETGAESYDWRRNGWSGAGHLGDVRSYSAAAVLGNGEVLLTGGFGNYAPLATTELYDPTGMGPVQVTRRRSSGMLIGDVALLLSSGALLIGLLISTLRQRQQSGRRGDLSWIDADS